MRRPRYLGYLVLLGIAAGVIILASRRREPRYRERTLTGWLQECYDASLMETQRLANAQAAVRTIGAAKALPYLCRMAAAQDGPIRSWVIGNNKKWKIRAIKLREAEDTQQLAIAGFEILGTNAAPAVRELAKLLEDKDHAFTAVRCLDEIGKAAELPLIQGLTNQDWQVRERCIPALASATEDVDVYIARVKPSLKDPSGEVRITAVDSIGAQTEAPETAVPLLIAALLDSSEHVSSRAATCLAGFGTNSLMAFTALSNLVATGSGNAANAALKTLVTIAPDEALPILRDSVTRGSPSVFPALTALIDIAPEKALPVVLGNLRSAQSNARRGAVSLLCRYIVKTPEIQAAIELAASDPDPGVASGAKTFLTEQYKKAHPEESPSPDEPVYGGKSLGDWLNMQDSGGAFSEPAKDAIHHLGTNAIPALLARLVYVHPPVGLRAFEVNFDAVKAFIVLGEQARPALPKLLALMDDPNRDPALCAMLATCGMGADSMSALMKGLTNRFPDVRNVAASYLTDDFGARFPEQRRQAIPLLVNLLNDPDENVRMNMTNALKEIALQAAAEVGVK